MRRRLLFVLELIIVAALILITRCANCRDVFSNGQIYFTDADCYARMTRARICFEDPGAIIRHHDFENFPAGTSPHTTAPLDYLIVAIAATLSAFAAANPSTTLDLAGAIVSPLLAVATGIFLCWWSRRMRMRFRFALLTLFAVSPILVHGTVLGRPDHQSLLIGLIAVALCAEWTAMWREIPSCADGKLETCPTWDIISGVAWALAIWVSLYEPLILLALVIVMSSLPRRTRWLRAKWSAFAAVCVIAILIERRFPSWPARESFQSLQDWTGSIGELSRVPISSRNWFEWCSWLVIFTPILFWRGSHRHAFGGHRPPLQGTDLARGSDRPVLPSFLLAILLATFVLTMLQARWSYFFALVFALLAPEILSVIRRPIGASAVFLLALFPVAQAWDVTLSERASAIQAEKTFEQMELRSIASQIDGPLLAPWWFSPALAYWSKQPAVAGSSHESITGIIDCASFYGATKEESAAEICRRRRVKWVVSYDSDRVAENSARILAHPIAPDALCYGLDRHPSAAPAFLKLARQTARFKLYRVEGL